MSTAVDASKSSSAGDARPGPVIGFLWLTLGALVAVVLPGASLVAAVIAILTTYRGSSGRFKVGVVGMGLAIFVAQVLLFFYADGSSSFEESNEIVVTVSE